jgi:hypothetical protein
VPCRVTYLQGECSYRRAEEEEEEEEEEIQRRSGACYRRFPCQVAPLVRTQLPDAGPLRHKAYTVTGHELQLQLMVGS